MTANAAGTRSTWLEDVVERSPLRDRRFLAFAVGNTINNVGEAVYALALPLLVFNVTGSLRTMSLLTAAVSLAFLVDPLLGAMVDRWGSRTLVVPGLLLQALVALAMCLLVAAGRFSIGWLLALVLLLEIGASAYRTGWITAVPVMFPIFPVRARGTLNSLYFATTAVGPLVVAAALHVVSYVGLLWMNLLTFMAPLAVWFLGLRPPAQPVRAPARSSRLEHLAGGWRATWQDPRLRTLLVVRGLLTLCFGPGMLTMVLYRLRAEWHLSGSGVARVVALAAVCALLGNISVAQRRTFRPRRCLTASSLAFIVAASLLASSRLGPFVVGVAMLGVATGSLIGTAVLMPVRYLPQEVLGRGYALIGAVIGCAALASPLVTYGVSTLCGPRLTPLVLVVGAVGALVRLRSDVQDAVPAAGPPLGSERAIRGYESPAGATSPSPRATSNRSTS